MSKDGKTGAATLGDGEYLVDVSIEGGTGRASVSSPTEVTVEEGSATAVVEWSSPNYDYMVVDGTRYLPTNDGGNSTFCVPVLAFDEPFEVICDTTAMSRPHEVTYELTFDSSSARPTGTSAAQLPGGVPWVPLVGVLALAAAATAFVAKGRRAAC
jgi:hypothetical protein